MLALSLTQVFAPAITFALDGDVVTEQCSENKILFRGKGALWSLYQMLDSVHTGLTPEKEIYPVVAHRLNQIVDALTLEFLDG